MARRARYLAAFAVLLATCCSCLVGVAAIAEDTRVDESMRGTGARAASSKSASTRRGKGAVAFDTSDPYLQDISTPDITWFDVNGISSLMASTYSLNSNMRPMVNAYLPPNINSSSGVFAALVPPRASGGFATSGDESGTLQWQSNPSEKCMDMQWFKGRLLVVGLFVFCNGTRQTVDMQPVCLPAPDTSGGRLLGAALQSWPTADDGLGFDVTAADPRLARCGFSTVMLKVDGVTDTAVCMIGGTLLRNATGMGHDYRDRNATAAVTCSYDGYTWWDAAPLPEPITYPGTTAINATVLAVGGERPSRNGTLIASVTHVVECPVVGDGNSTSGGGSGGGGPCINISSWADIIPHANLPWTERDVLSLSDDNDKRIRKAPVITYYVGPVPGSWSGGANASGAAGDDVYLSLPPFLAIGGGYDPESYIFTLNRDLWSVEGDQLVAFISLLPPTTPTGSGGNVALPPPVIVAGAGAASLSWTLLTSSLPSTYDNNYQFFLPISGDLTFANGLYPNPAAAEPLAQLFGLSAGGSLYVASGRGISESFWFPTMHVDLTHRPPSAAPSTYGLRAASIPQSATGPYLTIAMVIGYPQHAAGQPVIYALRGTRLVAGYVSRCYFPSCDRTVLFREYPVTCKRTPWDARCEPCDSCGWPTAPCDNRTSSSYADPRCSYALLADSRVPAVSNTVCANCSTCKLGSTMRVPCGPFSDTMCVGAVTSPRASSSPAPSSPGDGSASSVLNEGILSAHWRLMGVLSVVAVIMVLGVSVTASPSPLAGDHARPRRPGEDGVYDNTCSGAVIVAPRGLRDVAADGLRGVAVASARSSSSPSSSPGPATAEADVGGRPLPPPSSAVASNRGQAPDGDETEEATLQLHSARRAALRPESGITTMSSAAPAVMEGGPVKHRHLQFGTAMDISAGVGRQVKPRSLNYLLASMIFPLVGFMHTATALMLALALPTTASDSDADNGSQHAFRGAAWAITASVVTSGVAGVVGSVTRLSAAMPPGTDNAGLLVFSQLQRNPGLRTAFMLVLFLALVHPRFVYLIRLLPLRLPTRARLEVEAWAAKCTAINCAAQLILTCITLRWLGLPVVEWPFLVWCCLLTFVLSLGVYAGTELLTGVINRVVRYTTSNTIPGQSMPMRSSSSCIIEARTVDAPDSSVYAKAVDRYDARHHSHQQATTSAGVVEVELTAYPSSSSSMYPIVVPHHHHHHQQQQRFDAVPGRAARVRMATEPVPVQHLHGYHRQHPEATASTPHPDHSMVQPAGIADVNGTPTGHRLQPVLNPAMRAPKAGGTSGSSVASSNCSTHSARRFDGSDDGDDGLRATVNPLGHRAAADAVGRGESPAPARAAYDHPPRRVQLQQQQAQLADYDRRVRFLLGTRGASTSDCSSSYMGSPIEVDDDVALGAPPAHHQFTDIGDLRGGNHDHGLTARGGQSREAAAFVSFSALQA